LEEKEEITTCPSCGEHDFELKFECPECGLKLYHCKVCGRLFTAKIYGVEPVGKPAEEKAE